MKTEPGDAHLGGLSARLQSLEGLFRALGALGSLSFHENLHKPWFIPRDCGWCCALKQVSGGTKLKVATYTSLKLLDARGSATTMSCTTHFFSGLRLKGPVECTVSSQSYKI